jgi:threonine aldolase
MLAAFGRYRGRYAPLATDRRRLASCTTAAYDFRSDTVTLPTPDMQAVMTAAPIGDDVYGEDASVRRLEGRVADLFGKQAAVFCASGTLTNLLAHAVHCRRLQDVVCDARSHLVRWEGGGVHAHTGAAVNVIDPERHGEKNLTAALVAAAWRHDHSLYHQPVTSTVSLENTLSGAVMPFSDIQRISALARSNGAAMHLDGARIWNACVATGISAGAYGEQFDTLSVCMSKGLGAPVGSLLLGTHAHIEEARHLRKLHGGGWRQAGMLAAAAEHALDRNWSNMQFDHANARTLSNGLEALGFNITCAGGAPETNMVFAKPPGVQATQLVDALRKEGLLVGTYDHALRFVLHHQTPREAVDTLLEAVGRIVCQHERTQQNNAAE